MRSFMKIKSLQYGEIIPLFTDIGKSYPGCEFQTSQICLLTPFTKIKFSRKISGFTVFTFYKCKTVSYFIVSYWRLDIFTIRNINPLYTNGFFLLV